MQEYDKYNTREIYSHIPVQYTESWEYEGRNGSAAMATNLTVSQSTPSLGEEVPYLKRIVSLQKDMRRFSGRTHNKGGLPFHPTEYYIFREEVNNFLTKVPVMGTQTQIHRQTGYTVGWGYPTPATTANSVEVVDVSYADVRHADPGVPIYTLNGFDSSSVSDAHQQVQADLANKALSRYDVLTDLAQMKDVPRLVTSVSGKINTILRGMVSKNSLAIVKAASSMRPLDLLKHSNKLFRKLGNQWMEYRYAIMPLLLSYRDAKKAVERGIVVRDRKSINITPESLNVTPPSSEHLQVSYNGSITISGSVIQRFSSTSLARLSGMGFNPFLTAWELVPYSWVVDWFIGVGDFINAQTSATYADECCACISHREKFTKTTNLYLPAQTITRSGRCTYNSPRCNPFPATVTPSPFQRAGGLQVRQTVVSDNYWRNVVNLYDVPLKWRPSLNWRRLCDAAVLSNRLLQSLLTTLRR